MKTLLVAAHLLKLDRIVSRTDHLLLVVHSIQAPVRCPKCARVSSHLHSRYERTLADLPWQGIAVQIKLQARRFFCNNESCAQQIFCERLPELALRYARKTLRLNEALQWIGLMIGGEAGAKVAAELGFRVSPDTLLRRIRAANLPVMSTPKVLGVDDWAKRKGQTYGTILVDLERHRVVDLLPDREATTLTHWLKQHAGIEIITRDRAAAYAEGARQGAPDAIQIADRWHLIKNLTEVVERFLQTKYSDLQVAAKQNRQQPVTTPTVVKAESKQLPRTRLALWNERRQARYEEVRRFWQQGATIKRIAEQFGMHRRTVRMFIRTESCPERLKPCSRISQLDRHLDYLAQRWAEGCHSAADLYRELLSRGFRGSQSLVRHYVAQWRSELPPELKRARRGPGTAMPTIDRKKLLVPSPRNTAWWLLQKQENLEAEQQVYLQKLCEASPEIAQVQQLAQRFARLVRERKALEFSSWLEEAAKNSSPEIRGFVAGLKRDQPAVEAALKYAWSNGQTEGQVNKLKNLKRSMFGRAKFDLLKARVLAAP